MNRHLLGVAAVALAFALAGCAGEGEVYPRPKAEVEAVLLKTELPFPLNGTSHASMRTGKTPEGVELALEDAKGQAQLRFLAKATDEGQGRTRVAISYIGAGKAYAVADKGMADHPEIKAVYLKAVREQVDAQLENRAFNNLEIGPEMMMAFAANAGSIVSDMKAAGDEYRRRDKENIDKAYAAEARGEW